MSAVPSIRESDFQKQVTELAELLGWSWAHFRPAETARGWRTPVSGPLGKGFPDLVLVHPVKRRVLFAELKRDGAKLSVDQRSVIDTFMTAGAQCATWWPADWDLIVRELQA